MLSLRTVPALFLLTLCPLPLSAGEDARPLLEQASEAFRKGKNDAALDFANKAVEVDSTNAGPRAFRGRLYAALNRHADAVTDFDAVLKIDAERPDIHQARGVSQFLQGKIAESISDFDVFVKAFPERDAHHWQRGISYYYAKRFDEGRKQFERHQTVNPNDVENSAWHFLCTARAVGLVEARKVIIPIEGDGRIPMAEVHRMFKGERTPDEVLVAARAGNPPEDRLKRQIFYAHLYIGLYHEACGKDEDAKKHILEAAKGYGEDDYMAGVAKVHAQLIYSAKP